MNFRQFEKTLLGKAGYALISADARLNLAWTVRPRNHNIGR